MQAQFVKMKEFLQQAYKGLFCNLCDASKAEFFDTTAKKIYVSEKFCRDIVQNSVHNLLFFRAQLLKLTNLILVFMSSCNFQGRYLSQSVPAQLIQDVG